MCSVVTYTELHLHSAYSFLDGASMPDEIVPRALELGHEAVALTDHNSLSGAMEFAQHAKALGLRALHGAEIDLDDQRHLTLLVRDAAGWRNLCRLLTRAHADTREAGRPGWVGEPSVSLADVVEHAEGLVCLSGCARQGVHDEPGCGGSRASSAATICGSRKSSKTCSGRPLGEYRRSPPSPAIRPRRGPLRWMIALVPTVVA